MDATVWERRRVYDPVLRIVHGWNALVLAALLATGWSTELVEHGPWADVLWRVHVLLGYGLVIGLVARAVWGVVGPRHARFADLWHPRAWVDAVRLQRPRATRRFGHDELASIVYLAVYALLAAMAVTGLALAAIEHDTGPLAGPLGDAAWLRKAFGEPHEAMATMAAAFVGVHVIALIVHERLQRNRIAQSMLTGFQYRRREESGHA